MKKYPRREDFHINQYYDAEAGGPWTIFLWEYAFARALSLVYLVLASSCHRKELRRQWCEEIDGIGELEKPAMPFGQFNDC